MARMTDEEKAERKAAREAEQWARLEEAAKAEAAKAPPMSEETKAFIRRIFDDQRRDNEAKARREAQAQQPPAKRSPAKQRASLVTAALALWQTDIELAPGMRSLDPSEMQELHDTLVQAGKLQPHPEFTGKAKP